MVFGISLGTAAGLAGAVFYVVHHIAIQTTLFLATGLVERRGGTTNTEKLGGLAKASPLLAILFFVPAMNLAGIPPLSGFIGKLGLIEAGVALGGVGPYVLVGGRGGHQPAHPGRRRARVWGRAFWRPRAVDTADEDLEAIRPAAGTSATTAQLQENRLPATMVAATAGFVVLTVAITVFGGVLYGVADRAAVDLLDRTPYLESVFGLR